MHTPAAAAAEVAVARQKAKQAQDACRKAAQRLSQAASVDVYGQRTCADTTDVDAVLALVRIAMSEHDQIEVVVLTTTSRQ